MTETGFEYGVLLPHFGRYATAARIRGAGPMIEGYGFDSVWVRDHIVQQPHAHEDPDLTFLDAFVTLSTVGARTERLTLASAVIIPHRHPILAAMMFGSLDFVTGGGRIIAGLGIGNWDSEFEAIGMGGWDRKALLPDYVGILRELWTGARVSHESEHYRFADVQLSPVPLTDAPIPIWYGGNSAAAVRRAVEYCDGWVASRIPITSLEARVRRAHRLAREAGQAPPRVGAIPYIVPADTVEQGWARVNLEALLADLNAHEPPPPSGAFRAVDDVGGAAIAGPADVIVERVRQLQHAGVQHFVFDLRPCLQDWEDRLTYLGERVLPQLHAGDGRDQAVA